MVSAERDSFQSRRFILLQAEHDSSRVAGIGTYDHISVEKRDDHSGAAHHAVDAGGSVESLVGQAEGLPDVGVSLVGLVAEPLVEVLPLFLQLVNLVHRRHDRFAPVVTSEVLVLVSGRTFLAGWVYVEGLEVAAGCLLVLDQRRQYHVFLLGYSHDLRGSLTVLLPTIVNHLHKHCTEYAGKVFLDKVGDHMPIDSMAVANAKHPKTLDTSQVLHTYKAILIRFRLRGNETLPGLNCKGVHKGDIRGCPQSCDLGQQ